VGAESRWVGREGKTPECDARAKSKEGPSPAHCIACWPLLGGGIPRTQAWAYRCCLHQPCLLIHRTLSHIHKPPALCLGLDLVELGDPSAAQRISTSTSSSTRRSVKPRHAHTAGSSSANWTRRSSLRSTEKPVLGRSSLSPVWKERGLEVGTADARSGRRARERARRMLGKSARGTRGLEDDGWCREGDDSGDCGCVMGARGRHRWPPIRVSRARGGWRSPDWSGWVCVGCLFQSHQSKRCCLPGAPTRQDEAATTMGAHA
jgi:hypothetical protein